MQKKLLRIGAGLLLFFLAILLIVPVVASKKLDRLIEKANQDGGQLSIGSRTLAFRLTHFNLSADSVRLNQSPGGQQLEGTIAHLEVNGLKLFPLLLNDRIRISEVLLEQPEIILRVMAKDTMNQEEEDDGPDIKIGETIIKDGSFDWYTAQQRLALRALGLQLRSTALQLPLAPRKERDPGPAAAPALLFSSDSLIIPQKEKADWSFSEVKLDTDRGQLELGTVKLSPRQAVRPFLTALKMKDDWLALRLDDVLFEDVLFDSLMAGGLAVLPKVSVEDFNLLVFENPALPSEKESEQKDFFVEKFRKLPVPVLLQELRVTRAEITYGVLLEESSAEEINFREGSLSLKNFSTYPQGDSAVITADFTFGERSPLQARFALDQSGGGRHFSATGELRDYDMTDINPFMSVAAEAFVEGGHLNKLNYNFSVTNEVADGKLLLLYDGLELKLDGKKAWLKNIMEDIAIRDSNPRSGGDLVHGTVYNEHEAGKSFFNLYWKSIVSGLRSSVSGKMFTPKELKATELR
ncbi:hypothetical protein [Neolewinella agarilytica]|uniref:hypothetical protein n=1 Tax=Neolewinella agarilytica TaxID=478744 RepID=UPI002355CF2A|nr:hypothetical protein [Neolewinella agarilytica]